jgi:class 3 adenylate cyclase
MRHDLQEGALVLADISGFTEFVTATEIDHGPPLIAELLETVIGQISPPLEIQEVEGDAVFALGPDGALGSRHGLIEALESAFAAFRRRREELAADESCGCAACRSVGSLDLKIVVHHGRFLRQEVGGRSQVAGPAVILAHRLLKNDVADRAYLLLTEPALRWAKVDPAEVGLRAHLERYEHLGDVRCFVKGLGEPERRTAARAA